MRARRYGYFIVVSWLLHLAPAWAQSTYPIQVNTHLLPPYSLYLSDYYSGTRDKLAVTLINRDQNTPSVNVRLRMTITAAGGIRIQTNENAVFQPVLVEAGAPVRLTQEDLAPYFQPNNLITQGFLAAGRMPEGMVEFCFQAVEAYTGRVLSASTCTRAWITSQKPPLLSLPANNESVVFREPLNVMFQWTPMHQGLAQVEYDFILKELWDNGMTPQAAFAYSPEIYRETTRSTSIIYGAFQPPLIAGKRYAWCVRAKARDGMDEVNVFQNDGYSEIRWFRLQDDCLPPAYVEASPERTRINFKWEPLPAHIGFTISYREKSRDDKTQNEWKELPTQQALATVYGLKSGTVYEYRIGSMCMAGQPVYTPVMEVLMPAVDSARLAQCGILPDLNLLNQEPAKELKTSEVFRAGDFPVTIVAISGANGTFTGQGWTVIPWLNDAKVAVEFRNIGINTDRQMIRGFVEAKYDKTEGQIANLDELFEGGFNQGNVVTGLTRTDTTFNFVIPGTESFSLDDNGQLVIVDSDKKSHVIPVADPAQVAAGETPQAGENEGDKVLVFPMTVKDKAGNVYQVEKTSALVDGQTKDVVKATKLGTIGMPLAADAFDTTMINADKGIVRFNRGSGKYSFDTWQAYYKDILLIRDKYKKMGADYYSPWALLPGGASDDVSATIQVVDTAAIDPAQVIFITKEGTRYDAAYANNSYTLRVTAGPEGDVQELFALHPKGDGKYYTLGKLGIATYARQEREVVLVAVENVDVDYAAVEKTLRQVFDSVGISWTIRRDTMAFKGTGLMAEATGLSTYNEKMRTLNDTYRARRPNFSSSANYLFLLKATGNKDINNRDLTGFMPRGGQFGYIFTSEIANKIEPVTIAHELGHGRWKLFHPFDKNYGAFENAKYTRNLMAYGNGTHLAKWQWDQLADPAWIVSVFEGDERSGHRGATYAQEITRLIEMIRCGYLNGAEVSYVNPNSTNSFELNDFELTPQIKLRNLAVYHRAYGKSLIASNYMVVDPHAPSDILVDNHPVLGMPYFRYKETQDAGYIVFGSRNKKDLETLRAFLQPDYNTWKLQSEARVKTIEQNYRSGTLSYDALKDLMYSYPCALDLITNVDLKFEILKRIAGQTVIEGQSEVVVTNILNSVKKQEDAAKLIGLINKEQGMLVEFDDDFSGEEYKDYYSALVQLFLRSRSLATNRNIDDFTAALKDSDYDALLDNNLAIGQDLAKQGILLWSDPGYIKFFTETGMTAINYSGVTIDDKNNVSFTVDHVSWRPGDKDFAVTWPAFKPVVVLVLTSSKDINLYGTDALFRGQAMIMPAIAVKHLNKIENTNAAMRYFDAAMLALPVGHSLKTQRFVYMGVEIVLFSVQQLFEDYRAELELSEAGRVALRAWMVFNLVRTVAEMSAGSRSTKSAMDNLVTKLDDLEADPTVSAKAKQFARETKTVLAVGDQVQLSSAMDFTDVVATGTLTTAKSYMKNVPSGDQILDVVVHGSGNQYSLVENGLEAFNHRSLSNWIRQNTPANSSVRLLSCASIESAQDVANNLGRNVIACDGRVRVYSDGGIMSVDNAKWYELTPNKPRVAVDAPKRPGDGIVNYIELGILGRIEDVLPKLKMPSDAHSVNTIGTNTRFGGGDRNTLKTVAKGNVDLRADYDEIVAGRATYDKGSQTFNTSTGRKYGYHPDNISTGGTSAIYPISGKPGEFVDLTQAEFNVLKKMTETGGLNGSSRTMLDGLLRSGNAGVNLDSERKLLDLFNTRR